MSQTPQRLQEFPADALRRPRMLPFTSALDRIPYWLLAAIALAIVILVLIFNSEDYEVIFAAVSQGIGVTIRVTIVAYALALIIGLIVGLGRISSRRVVMETSSFYVEIVRGLPMLVLLYYIVFAGAPGLVDAVNWAGIQLRNAGVVPGLGDSMATFSVRNLSFVVRVVLALSIGYSAFLAEIFRAGIQSIDRGQHDAARALGMTYWQSMRFVILPQAVRRVLPPLGNDFIAMLKDSALVSVMGVADITYQGKIYAASTFKFFETYNIVGFLYLVMTITLSLLVRYTEKRLKTAET